MRTPPPCDQPIFENGSVVLYTHSIPTAQIERWVKKVAKLSGQPTDWHFAGGRAVVLTTGDVLKVLGAALLLKDEHDALQQAEFEEMLPNHPYAPSWRVLVQVPGT